MRHTSIQAPQWPFRIGCLADTHIPRAARAVPDSVLAAMAGVDLILHAGDLVTEAVLDQLATVAEVRAVAGNMDPEDLAARLGRSALISIGPWRVGLTHGDQGLGKNTPDRAWRTFGADVDVVVFGHSHQALCQTRDGVLLLNPGSPTDARWAFRATCGLITLSSADRTVKPQGQIISLG